LQLGVLVVVVVVAADMGWGSMSSSAAAEECTCQSGVHRLAVCSSLSLVQDACVMKVDKVDGNVLSGLGAVLQVTYAHALLST
jgi:hypothetical protein